MAFLKTISSAGTDDQQLVVSYKQEASLNTLAELYQRYMELVYGVCLKYLKDEEKAKDAVMAIFEELIVKLKKHEVSHFKSWLYALAKNHCLMQLRATKNRLLTSMDTEPMQIAEDLHLNDIFEQEEQLDRLQDCLSTLSAQQKAAVSQFYLQKKSYKEIASATGSDWDQVRSLIQNGRRNLKLCMEKKQMTQGEGKK